MVLLVEDDVFKGSHEKRALKHVYPGKILWEKDFADGMETLKNYSEKIDFIFLDMYFPLEYGEVIYPECGLKFLKEMNRLGYGGIPVIVCSTVPMQLLGHKNVLGCICYHRELDLEQEIIRIWKEQEFI
ncbi:hypothetical protein AALB52_17590 [Lachnospiraceae bacterium 38-14]|jgi:hypothetical protein|uniref:hypothetical protein n=1 Tax=Roseburia sp. 1XD42-69 TaxID=2320088 RepID=UPI000EA1185A|nr:hypothetical protein [Roseburia sp. 1XD42-69]MCX4319989.1 hypothetical protein [Lachnospiraceae bacterium]RKJ68199.1 hypothetical protein D7Y06_02250 [Roseburia sp. 1XD42-69]